MDMICANCKRGRSMEVTFFHTDMTLLVPKPSGGQPIWNWHVTTCWGAEKPNHSHHQNVEESRGGWEKIQGRCRDVSWMRKGHGNVLNRTEKDDEQFQEQRSDLSGHPPKHTNVCHLHVVQWNVGPMCGISDAPRSSLVLRTWISDMVCKRFVENEWLVFAGREESSCVILSSEEC